MLVLVCFIAVIILGIIANIQPDVTTKKPREQIQPPTNDVEVFGCNYGSCGYAKPKYDGHEFTGITYCGYLQQNVEHGCKCPYAERYPDKLRKGLLDEIAEESRNR